MVQKSSTGSGPSAVKELHETKTIRDNVDRASKSLPLQTLQDVVTDVKEAQQIQEEEKLRSERQGRDGAAGRELKKQI